VRGKVVVPLILWLLGVAGAASAQDLSRRVMEVSGGFAGFIDESIIPHATLGTALRWDLGRHVSIGPELVFMNAANDFDLFLTGKLVVDFRRTRAVSPYFVADGGLMLHRATFPREEAFWVQEGAVSFGGGARIAISPRLFVAPEMRIGWEPHIRFTALVGWRL
jgi:hypothetical protein